MCSLLSHLIGIGSQHHTYSKARAKNGTSPKLSVIYDIMSVSCVFADKTGIYLSKKLLDFWLPIGILVEVCHHFVLDFVHELGVVLEHILDSVFALSELGLTIAEPGAALFDDAEFDCQ